MKIHWGGGGTRASAKNRLMYTLCKLSNYVRYISAQLRHWSIMKLVGEAEVQIHVYLPYRGAISFYVYIAPLGLINIFLHVERDKIFCGLQPTRFFLNFL